MRPAYKWIDPAITLNETAWNQWGIYMPAGLPEPNNLFAPEDCGVGNFSEPNDQDVASWADTKCSNKYVFICKILRGLPGLQMQPARQLLVLAN